MNSNFIRKNFLLIIVVSLTIIILGSIILFSVATYKLQPEYKKDQFPSPIQIAPTITLTLTPLTTLTPVLTKEGITIYSDTYKKSAETIREQEKNILERYLLISQFKNDLPYEGQYIQVNYDLKIDRITVIINKDYTDKGNKELDELFKSNNIENRDWVRDLVIIYQ